MRMVTTLNSEKEVVYDAGVTELTHLHDWTQRYRSQAKILALNWH